MSSTPTSTNPNNRLKRNLNFSARVSARSTATVAKILTENLGVSLTSRSDMVGTAVDLLASILAQRFGVELISTDEQALRELSRLNLLEKRNVVLSEIDWSEVEVSVPTTATVETADDSYNDLVEQIKRDLGEA